MSQVRNCLQDARSGASLKLIFRITFLLLFVFTSAFAMIGDIDHSGRVDGYDLILLSKARNTALDDAEYNAAADLDGDGMVNDTDLALLTDNFGFAGRAFSLWVADTSGHRVVKLADDSQNALVNLVSLNTPVSVSVNNQNGTLWIADTYNNRILKLSPQGDVLLYIVGFNLPRSVSVNESDGSCWVADTGNNRIIKLLPGVTDNYNVSVDTGAHLTIAGFSSPRSVSVDSVRGDCWVADTYHDTVVKLDADITDGYDIGAPPPGFSYHTSMGGFNDPMSVSVNTVDGSCWVADYYKNRVVKLSASNTTLLLTLGGFNYLRSVSVNPTDGSCWVADTNNNQVVHLSATGVELSRTDGFSYPYAVSVNPWDGSCWVADRSHGQAVKILLGGAELVRVGTFNNPEGVALYSGIPLADEPTAAAMITPTTADVGEIVTFNGSGQDTNGTIDKYEWDFEGDGIFDWESTLTGETTFLYPSEGIYTPVFRVTDNSGKVALWYGTLVHIGTLRAIPGADVTSGPAPLTVAFTADFYDPVDGRIASYEWDFDGDGLYDYYSATSGNITHIYDIPGIYAATLKVVDSDFTTATAFITISVISAAPVATAAADPLVGPPPLAVTFIGTATDDGIVMLYEWDFDGDGVYDWISTGGGMTTHSYTTSGTYSAIFRATDNDGLQHTDTVSVIVNFSPVVTVSATPLKGNVGMSVSFDCSASDLDGTISSYEWDFNGDGVFDWMDAASCSVVHDYTSAGTYTAAARVTDSSGTPVEETVEIIVLPTGTPVATASLTPTSGYIPLDVTFTGSAVDVGGAVVYYEWSFGDEPGSTFADDMESGAGSWAYDSPWALDTTDSHSTTTSWTDSPGSNYAVDVNASLISPTFDLSAAQSPTLEFWHHYNTEYYDYCRVEISTDNGASWSQLTYYRTTQADWQLQVLDLSAYVGSEHVKIRFRLQANGNATVGDGWYIDDVRITGIRPFGYQSGSTGATTHTYTSPGNYQPIFRVSDNSGNQDSVKLDVTVDPGLSTAVAEAVPAEGLVPLTVNLTGNSSTDPNGTIDLYEWYIKESNFLILNENGYPTTQLFIGPWNGTGCSDVSSHQIGIEDEQPGAGDIYGGLTWFSASDDDGIWDWQSVDIFGPVTNVYGYSYINIYSKSIQDVRIKLGSDDYSRFWVNGLLVYTKRRCEPVTVDQYSFDVTLQKGWNSVLAAVSQGTGTYGLAYRITDTNDEPLRLSYTVSSLVEGSPDWSSTVTGNTTYTYTQPGSYVAALRITDNDGYTAVDTAFIKAQQQPQATIVSPANGSDIGQDVIFRVETNDVDGKVVLSEWDFDGDGIFEYSTSSTGSSFHSYDWTGTFTPTLRITDDDGLTDTTSITITIINYPPEITSIGAAPDEGNQPLQVIFTATTGDVDGNISSYGWDFDNDGVTDWESVSSADTTYTYTTAGNFNAVLEVTDNRGQSSSRSVPVEVKGTGTPMVTASASPVPSYTGHIVRLGNETSAGDGQIIRYEWDFDGDGTFDWLDSSEGAVASYSTQRDTASWAADNLIDGQVGSAHGWSSASYPTYPQELVFSLSGLQIYTVDQVAINPYTTDSSNYWCKDFELLVSVTGLDADDFISVGSFQLAKTGVEQFFSFPAVSAKYVKLRILSSQNSTVYTELGEFKVFAQGDMDNLLAIDGVNYHVYDTGGTYNAVVKVMNSLVLTDTDTVEVVVYPVGESAAKIWIVDRSHDQLVQLTADGSEIKRIGGITDPYAIDVYQSDGSVWVTDFSTDVVVKFDEEGTELFRVTGFIDPYRVSVDQSDGSVWVASYAQNQVVKLDAAGDELLRLGDLNRPTSVDVNSNDHTSWVVEGSGNRAIKFAADGTILARVSGFNGPRDVAVNPVDGTVWIADRYNDRVVRLVADTPDNYSVTLGRVTVANDSTANASDGSLIGDASHIVAGKLNNGIQFDGSGDYVRINHSAVYRPTTAVTVETWFMADDWSRGDQALVSVTESGGWNFSTLGSRLRFTTEINDVYYEAGVDSAAVSTGVWHHLAGVYDGSNVHFYLDGVLQESTPATGLITYHASNALLVGGEAGGGTTAAGQYFFGRIDDLRIWGRALTDTEIQGAKDVELTGSETDLLGYWQFNEGVGPFHKIIPGFNDPVFVDVNQTDGTCWVSDYLNGQMVQISADGETELARASGYYNPHMPAVNHIDGTVWTTDYSHYQIVKLSANGMELTRRGGYYNPSGAAIDFGLRNLSQPPVAQASASPLSGDAPLTVTFVGSGTDNGSIISYEWDFDGDGIYDYSSDSSGNTSHTFTRTGVYRPVFRITDNDNLVAFKYLIIQAGGLTVDATASPDKGPAPLVVSFTGSAMSVDSLLSSYEWDFDGNGSYDWSSAVTPNVNHTFATSGLYLSRLRVSNNLGLQAETIVPVTVSSTRPVAKTIVTPNSGSYPLMVTLTNNGSFDSDGSIVLYEWDYDGDGVFDYNSTTQGSTSFRYMSSGTFYPTLRVTDNDGFTDEDRKQVITSGMTPVAHATATPDEGIAPLSVHFEGTGTDDDGSIAFYEWSFGDYAFLSDDVESGNSGWQPDHNWAIVDSYSHSSSHSWTDSPAGMYDNNLDTSLTSIVLDLSEAQSPMLSFYHRYDLETDYDFAYVEVLSGDSSWTPLATYTGISDSWGKVNIDLDNYKGSDQVMIRFRLFSDDYFTRDGWYIDDIRVHDSGYFSWSSDTSGILDRIYTEVGIFNATLRVTDDTGLSVTDSVKVTVQPTGSPKAVIQASPQTGGNPLHVTFDGSSSTDADGSIVKYEWDFGNQIKVESAGYRDGNYCAFYVNGSQFGTNNRGHNLVVLDEDNLQVLESRSFDTYGVITAADEMASFIRAIPEGRIVLVAIKDEGSRYMNNNGYSALELLGSQLTRDVGYHDSWAIIGIKGASDRSPWEKHSVEYGGKVTVQGGGLSYSSASGAPFIYTYFQSGIFVARLQVTDNSGLTDYDIATISIGNPVALPAAYPATGLAPLTVNFICNGEDVDGTIEYFNWDFDGNGTYDSSSRRSDTVTHTFATPGIYEARLQVIDNAGLRDEKGLTITVLDENADGRPRAYATASPVEGDSPLVVAFSGHGTDLDGTLKLFEWDYEGDGTFDWSSTEHGDTVHTYLTAGLHPAVLRVTDDKNNQGTDSLLIKVRLPGGPIAEASASPLSGDAPLDVAYSGSVSSTRDITLYEWDFNGDGTYDWSSAESGDTTHRFTSVGVYNSIFRITDDQGAQDLDPVTITVNMIEDLSVARSVEAFDPDRGQIVKISTALSFAVDSFTLRINDSAGITIRRLVDGVVRDGGVYTDIWDGRNAAAEIVSSGVYFFVIDYEVDGHIYHYDLTGDSGTMSIITPTYSTEFIPIEDKFLTATFLMNGPAEITTYVSPFSGGAGARIRTIHLRTPRKSGTHVIVWDGIMDDGTLAPLDQSYVMAVFAYGLSDNALIVARKPIVSNVFTEPDFYNPGNLYNEEIASIHYTLFKDADVTVSIYNDAMYLLNRWTELNVTAGQNSVQWAGRDFSGILVAPGIYRIDIKATDEFGNSSEEANGLIEIFY